MPDLHRVDIEQAEESEAAQRHTGSMARWHRRAAGIGFTMSLFIAGEAFPNLEDFAAAKIAIFSSLAAGVVGTAILGKNVQEPSLD